MNRKINMGMIGGGRGAFIGAVHRSAALLDGHIEMVCGALSADPEKARLSGEDWYLESGRSYASWQDMIREEAKLPLGKKMDLVVIVTPNHLHFQPAKAALEAGFHVVCDKPVTFDLSEALELEKIIQKTGLIFALTHTYTGYPMVKQARDMVEAGAIGKIRKVIVEYPQGWLSTALEKTGQKQASWRTDPKKSGKGGATGDIGTHAAHLAEYITGLKINELCADTSIFIEGRQLDDDANVLLHFSNGAKGILHCSQICVGDENNLNIRVYGEKGGVEWYQMEPNTLYVKWLDKPREIYRTGGAGNTQGALAHIRVPAGHPEGYIEAFANIYRNVAMVVQAKINKREPDKKYLDFPTILDGIRGMKFIDAVIASGQSDKKWIKY
jgi:predicted dehydrogenase